MKIDYLYRSGGKEYASQRYNRRTDSNVLTLSLESSFGRYEHELSVDEALELSEQLAEYANDIKEHAAVLKEMEGFQNEQFIQS